MRRLSESHTTGNLSARCQLRQDGQWVPRPAVCPAGGAPGQGGTSPRTGPAQTPAPRLRPPPGPRRCPGVGGGRPAARGRWEDSSAGPGGAPASPPRPTAPGAGHRAPPPARSPAPTLTLQHERRRQLLLPS